MDRFIGSLSPMLAVLPREVFGVPELPPAAGEGEVPFAANEVPASLLPGFAGELGGTRIARADRLITFEDGEIGENRSRHVQTLRADHPLIASHAYTVDGRQFAILPGALFLAIAEELTHLSNSPRFGNVLRGIHDVSFTRAVLFQPGQERHLEWLVHVEPQLSLGTKMDVGSRIRVELNELGNPEGGRKPPFAEATLICIRYPNSSSSSLTTGKVPHVAERSLAAMSFYHAEGLAFSRPTACLQDLDMGTLIDNGFTATARLDSLAMADPKSLAYARRRLLPLHLEAVFQTAELALLWHSTEAHEAIQALPVPIQVTRIEYYPIPQAARLDQAIIQVTMRADQSALSFMIVDPVTGSVLIEGIGLVTRPWDVYRLASSRPMKRDFFRQSV